MKKCYAFFLMMFVLVSAQAQDGWFKQKVDERIAAKFPKAPEAPTAGGPVRVKDNDSCTYLLAVQDFGAMGLDSATLQMMAPSDEFIEEFKEGFATSAGMDIAKLDVGQWKGYHAYTVEAVTSKDQKRNVNMKCLFIGSKMYIVSFTAPMGFDGSKKREQFFNSVELL